MTTLRHDWTKEEIQAIHDLPIIELVFQAQQVHREHFPTNKLQKCNLLSIKTGACPEDCSYCSQSGHFKTAIEKEKLWDLEDVKTRAKQAKDMGATRFCMGAAWRSPPKKDFPKVLEMIKEVKALGMETCVTLGMLDEEHTKELKEAGLDYYNHNLDTSPEHYPNIVTTRTYQDRLDTIKKVRDAGINVCCGGILGLGEKVEDRISFLQQLANMEEHPKSVPINHLVTFDGTPLSMQKPITDFDFLRVIATARILMPKSFVRLSCGREKMSESMQTLCYMAGANSIFIGDKLLTGTNIEVDLDNQLLNRIGMTTYEHTE